MALIRAQGVHIDGHFTALDLSQAGNEVLWTQAQRGNGPAGKQSDVVRANVLRTRERAEIAHDARLEDVTRPANVARRREINPTLNLDVLGAGTVTPAAVAAILCLGKDLVQLSTDVPAILSFLDLIDMRAAWREIVDEADLHAVFD